MEKNTKVLIELDREDNIHVAFNDVSVVNIAALLLCVARDDKHFALALSLASIELNRNEINDEDN